MRFDSRRLRLKSSLAIAVLALVLLVELGGVAYRQHQLKGASSAAVATGGAASVSQSSSAVTSAVPTTVPVSKATQGSTTPTTTSTAGTAATTTTILTSPGIVHYVVPANTTVQLSITGTTWLEARTSPTGTILYAGTLSAGTVKSFETPVWIRFGNASNAKAAADGSPLQLPDTGVGDLEVTVG